MVLEGEFEVLITQVEGEEEGKETVVASVVMGGFFGERALLENKPRAASIRCKEAARTMAITRDQFEMALGAPLKELLPRLQECGASSRLHYTNSLFLPATATTTTTAPTPRRPPPATLCSNQRATRSTSVTATGCRTQLTSSLGPQAECVPDVTDVTVVTAECVPESTGEERDITEGL